MDRLAEPPGLFVGLADLHSYEARRRVRDPESFVDELKSCKDAKNTKTVTCGQCWDVAFLQTGPQVLVLRPGHELSQNTTRPNVTYDNKNSSL